MRHALLTGRAHESDLGAETILEQVENDFRSYLLRRKDCSQDDMNRLATPV
jgi:hypothetical protein